MRAGVIASLLLSTSLLTASVLHAQEHQVVLVRLADDGGGSKAKGALQNALLHALQRRLAEQLVGPVKVAEICRVNDACLAKVVKQAHAQVALSVSVGGTSRRTVVSARAIDESGRLVGTSTQRLTAGGRIEAESATTKRLVTRLLAETLWPESFRGTLVLKGLGPNAVLLVDRLPLAVKSSAMPLLVGAHRVEVSDGSHAPVVYKVDVPFDREVVLDVSGALVHVSPAVAQPTYPSFPFWIASGLAAGSLVGVAAFTGDLVLQRHLMKKDLADVAALPLSPQERMLRLQGIFENQTAQTADLTAVVGFATLTTLFGVAGSFLYIAHLKSLPAEERE